MSSSFFGHSIPIALRKFPRLIYKDLKSTETIIPEISLQQSYLLKSYIFCFSNKQGWDVVPWVDQFSRSDQFIENPPTIIFLKSRWKRLFHFFWRFRCANFYEAKINKKMKIGVCYLDIYDWKKSLGILNDDLTVFLLDPENHKIIFCSQGKFSPGNSPELLRKALDKNF